MSAPVPAAGGARALARRHLEALFLLCEGRPRAVLLGFLLLVALSAASVLRLPFETDVFRLFPAKEGPVRLFTESLEWSGGARDAYFLLEGERERLPGEAERLASRLKDAKVGGAPAFSSVRYAVADREAARGLAAFLARAAANPTLFLPPEEAERFADRFSPARVAESLGRAKAEIASLAGGGLTAADPLRLRDLLLPRFKESASSLDLDPSSPYFLSRDGKVLILVATPARPVQDLPFARSLVAAIREARRGASVSITCAGAHLSAVLDEEAMRKNVSACILSSLVLVLLLFFATYRRLLPTLLVPAILLSGVILALGTASLLLPSVHVISFAFTALIVGLGTDYSIHLYDRWHQERASGTEPREAVRLAVVDTGSALLTTTLTTALPFLAFSFSRVRALSELGLLVGLGVLFSLYATLLLLPVLLLRKGERERTSFPPLPSFGLGRAWELCVSRPRGVRAVSLALLVLLCAAIPRVFFDGDLRNLQPRHSEAFVTQERIERHLSRGSRDLLVVQDGEETDPLLERGRKVETLLDGLVSRGEATGYSSLGRILQPPSARKETGRRIGALLSGRRPGREVEAAMVREGFEPAPFREFLESADRLAAAAPGTVGAPAGAPPPGDAPGGAEGASWIAASPLSPVLDRHLAKGADGRLHLMTHVYYSPGRLPLDRFLADLRAADPEAGATGLDLVTGALKEEVRRSVAIAAPAGIVLMLLLLAGHFSSPRTVLLSLAPVAAGTAAMLGLMGISGMGLNYMNVMVLVTLLGIGSDYGLHVLHRTGAVPPGKRKDAFVQSGRAVLLSALTTVAGFGSLAFTDYGAMSSIGWATNFGVVATMLFALLPLPLLAGLAIGGAAAKGSREGGSPPCALPRGEAR